MLIIDKVLYEWSVKPDVFKDISGVGQTCMLMVVSHSSTDKFCCSELVHVFGLALQLYLIETYNVAQKTMQVYAVLALQMQLTALCLSMYRDSATVHINYKAQFTDQPAARGRQKASARDDLEAADDDLEGLDWDDEEDQRGGKRCKSSRGRQHASSSHDHEARGNGGEDAQPRQGQWITKNNHNVSHMQKHPLSVRVLVLTCKLIASCLYMTSVLKVLQNHIFDSTECILHT